MRDRHRISVRHWVSVALFLAYWLVAFIVCARQISKSSGEDSGFILQILVPVVAGALTAFSGGRNAVGSLWGAIFGILDFNLLVAINRRHLPPSVVSQSALGVLLMSMPVFGSISGALGFVGTVVGRLLRRDRVISLRLESHN